MTDSELSRSLGESSEVSQSATPHRPARRVRDHPFGSSSRRHFTLAERDAFLKHIRAYAASKEPPLDVHKVSEWAPGSGIYAELLELAPGKDYNAVYRYCLREFGMGKNGAKDGKSVFG